MTLLLVLTSYSLDLSTMEKYLGPCPHDTFPNRARSIATSSRPVARVHTGATGTLVPVSRDHLATWNERARSIAKNARRRLLRSWSNRHRLCSSMRLRWRRITVKCSLLRRIAQAFSSHRPWLNEMVCTNHVMTSARQSEINDM